MYVLPQAKVKPTQLVLPGAPQIGWKESLVFIYSASETTRDVTAKLVGFNGRLHKLLSYVFKNYIKRLDLPTEESHSKDGWVSHG